MLNRYLRLHTGVSVDFWLKTLLSTVLLVVLGPLVLDLKGMMPITIQTLLVLLGAIAFGWRIGTAATLIYIALGIAGLRVFANYSSGVDAIFGPFGGFFFGFIAATLVCGFLAEIPKFQKPIPAIMVWMLGHAIILLLGAIWLKQFDPLGWLEKMKVLIPGAIIKSLVGALIVQLIIRFYTREKKTAFED